jgi:hypothetical protein
LQTITYTHAPDLGLQKAQLAVSGMPRLNRPDPFGSFCQSRRCEQVSEISMMRGKSPTADPEWAKKMLLRQ